MIPLSLILLVLCACTDDPISVDANREIELSRQVNWAVIELNNFAAALREFRRDEGDDPARIEDLYFYMALHSYGMPGGNPNDNDYDENSLVHSWWNFRLIRDQDRVLQFYCISREAMIDGSGHQISYNLATGRYSGYRIDMIDKRLYPLLLEYFIDPTFLLTPGKEWNQEDFETHMLACRQVNWAASSMGAIYNAVKMYRQDYGEEPPNVQELIDLYYVVLSPPVLLWWDFTLVGENPILAIEAISSDQMALGAGRSFRFNTQTGRFEGELWEYISPWLGSMFIDMPVGIGTIDPGNG